ncbi:hypothetical protein [Amorphus orientalis]|uniref:Phosphoglycolate phosphatase-like HAD superfamily hydrolase n=1 Tax=Amorphus orientalis TaxID=649198 RepID=A0AAE3VRT9_9HYPH|nr:hypothetical protein [Amorphus orientalis]MDQ0317604.1 phosphoglycolate phosphatase-like HAD superfamily hydrolase [Amorphus orientalis]
MNAFAHLIANFGSPEPCKTPADPKLLPFGVQETPVETGPNLEEMEERVRAEARAEADARCETVRAEERARFERDLAEQREAWCADESARLATQMTTAWGELEDGIADSLARVIGPFVKDAVRVEAVAEIRRTITAVLSDAGNKCVRVTGPEDLLDRLASELGERAAGLSFEPGETVDIQVTADNTVIETQLGAWFERLASAIR